MKQISKRLIVALLAVIMAVTMTPIGALKASAAAVAQSSYATGNIITYGSYPQTKVTDAALISVLNTQTLQGDSTVTYGGSKYKLVSFSTTTNSYQAMNGFYINTIYWFKFEPIQWRVLSNTNGELLVMADKILASRAYNQLYTDVTWETCTMRSWLNDDFYNTAFNSTEQAKIKTGNVVNENNPWYSTSGGNNTSDKLFLLSYSEAMNPANGFSISDNPDTARVVQGTDYAKSQGLYVFKEDSSWWLRSPGGTPSSAGDVRSSGNIYYGNADYVSFTDLGVRPAYKINLTSDIFTSKAGSNCIINCLNDFVYGLAPGITSLVDYTDVAAGYELEYGPTANGFGTGTVVNVTLDGVTVESYTIVIYGDVNGDGSIDSIDAGTIVDVGNYIISWDPAADAATIEAGDLNGDGSIDGIDAGIVVDAENYIVTIDQTLG